MGRREMSNRPNPWRRSPRDDRAARTESIVSFVATVVVVLVLLAVAIWFFFFAAPRTRRRPASSSSARERDEQVGRDVDLDQRRGHQ